MEIIIKGDKENLERLKGRSLSELARNLESEGWPSEFANEGEKDRVKFIEKKLGRPATGQDIKNSKLFPKKRLPNMNDVE